MATDYGQSGEKGVRELFHKYMAESKSEDGLISHADAIARIEQLGLNWRLCGLDEDKVKAYFAHCLERKGKDKVTFLELWRRVKEAGRHRTHRDPAVQAEMYMERHRLYQVFQSMTRALAYNKPLNPKAFLIGKLRELKQSHSMPFFNAEDLAAVFTLFDVAQTGLISNQQANAALRTLGYDAGINNDPNLGGVNRAAFNKADFVSLMQKALDTTVAT
ncbi:hypothetical protein CBR_g9069 [Chara braunii]|uniref:EF-hand domain-containing protein n=1 Tax=Chara braunii TaxID=69332 RepID=A0A388KNN0_CHABU|nr:hypothetical protein CBR_g9069 [Chara braunii]|eukprot:GBG71654.1 hypothetical protein CBR_g9069 [Chara braunii]